MQIHIGVFIAVMTLVVSHHCLSCAPYHRKTELMQNVTPECTVYLRSHCNVPVLQSDNYWMSADIP
jgi:hypothetical protein